MSIRVVLRRPLVLAVGLSVLASLQGPNQVHATTFATTVNAGQYHTCALTTGGGVKCWGANNAGQLGDGTTTNRLTPVDATALTSGVAAISVGSQHTCALTSDGGVKCWGYNANGQLGDGTTTASLTPVDVTGLASGVAAISARQDHTCALTTGGGVKCWGSNSTGQLGDGTTTQRLTPVDVAGFTSGFAAISAGRFHTCALTNGGGVKCWGANNAGQLGDNTTTNRLTPVDATALTSGVAAISAGSDHTCGLKTGGDVKCWGWNNAGQLGDSTTTNRLVAVDVAGLPSGVAAISLGWQHTCALTSDGSVKCWGSNIAGQLGDGTATASLTPIDVTGLTSGVAAISAGLYHSCALMTGGGIKCWGWNDSGQLGNGIPTQRLTAVDVTGLTSSVATISAGQFHTCAVTTGGAAKCWGRNDSGQFGDGTTIDRLTPVDVTGLTSGTAAISAGRYHSCALTTGGGAKCWGWNGYGMLGDGTFTQRLTPGDVTGLTNGVAAIAAGIYHTCALTVGGGVKCWGPNSSGQLGDGTTTWSQTPVDVTGLTSGVAAISVGPSHTCALTTGGGVKCWGYNPSGELGDGSTVTRLTPVDVSGLTSDVAAISASPNYTCALTTGGGVKCWGSGPVTSSLTAVDVAGLTSGVAAIAGGRFHTCALTTSGGAKCWGYNADGQLGDGTTTDRPTAVDVTGLTSGVAAISISESYSCALTTSGGMKCWGWNYYGQLGNGERGYGMPPTATLGFGALCGDGTTELDEQCDDGNTTSGDCCSSTCQFETGPQSGCTDSNLCTTDACDGAGTCTHTPLPETDGDSVCDAQDACTNVGGARDFDTKSKLVLTKINTDTTPGNDGLKLSAAFDLPSASSFSSLNPIAHGARIVLLNQGGSVEMDQVLPGGAYTGSGTRGWKSNTKGTMWQYLDKTAAPLSGITTLKVTDKSTTSPGHVTASLTGKKTTYPVVSGDAPVQLVVVLGNQTDAIAGYCGESNFTPASCLFNGAQNSLVCRQ